MRRTSSSLLLVAGLCLAFASATAWSLIRTPMHVSQALADSGEVSGTGTYTNHVETENGFSFWVNIDGESVHFFIPVWHEHYEDWKADVLSSWLTSMTLTWDSDSAEPHIPNSITVNGL